MVSNGRPTLQQAATKLKNINPFKFCYMLITLGEDFAVQTKNKQIFLSLRYEKLSHAKKKKERNQTKR